jgi:hypothetical protein
MEKLITNDRIDSLLKAGQVEEALLEPIKRPDPGRNGIGDFVRRRANRQAPLAEDAAYAGLTLGDFLYNYIRIDPEVVRGVEFARAGDVDGVLSFASFADSKADLSGASLDGLHSELQGYVAEQIEAHHLIAQGHDVQFPDTPNNPGWDIKVDGHPFQIKCLSDAHGVYEHLHNYPDIPVIVNAELAEQVGDHSNVYVDASLHHDAVVRATEETLDRGRDLADFEIPWISLDVSVAFNLYYMLVNGTDFTGFLTCTATDFGARFIGGTTGKSAGAGAGLLVFGPAGAIVIGALGAVGGAIGGRRVVAIARQLLVSREAEAVREAVHHVAETAADAMSPKLEAWKQKSAMVTESLAGPKRNQTIVRAAMVRRMAEHIEYLTQKKVEIELLACDTTGDPGSLFERVLRLIRRAGIHAHHIQEPLQELASKIHQYSDKCKKFRVA